MTKNNKYLDNANFFGGLTFLIVIVQNSIIKISKFIAYSQSYTLWESFRKTFLYDLNIRQYLSETVNFWSGVHFSLIIILIVFAQLVERVIEKKKQGKAILIIENIGICISILLSFSLLVLLIIRYINFGHTFTIYGSYLSFVRYVCEFLAILFFIPYSFFALFSRKSNKSVGMFKSSSNVTFKTTKPQKEVLDVLEDELSVVGSVEISQDKSIYIDPSNYSGILTKSIITGTIRQKEEKFYVSIEHNSTLSTLGWILLIIGLFVYGLGLLVLLAPGLTRGELRGKLERALANVKFQI